MGFDIPPVLQTTVSLASFNLAIDADSSGRNTRNIAVNVLTTVDELPSSPERDEQAIYFNQSPDPIGFSDPDDVWFWGQSFWKPNGSCQRPLVHVKQTRSWKPWTVHALYNTRGGKVGTLCKENVASGDPYYLNVVIPIGGSYFISAPGRSHNHGYPVYASWKVSMTSGPAIPIKGSRAIHGYWLRTTECRVVWNQYEGQYYQTFTYRVTLIGIEKNRPMVYYGSWYDPSDKKNISSYTYRKPNRYRGDDPYPEWDPDDEARIGVHLSSERVTMANSQSVTSVREEERRLLVETYGIAEKRIANRFEWGQIRSSARSWNAMMFDACQDIGMWDSNGIAFLRDVATLPRLISDCAGLLESLTKDLSTVFRNNRQMANMDKSMKKFFKSQGLSSQDYWRFVANSKDPAAQMRRFIDSNTGSALKDILGVSANSYLSEHYAWRLSAIDMNRLANLAKFLGPMTMSKHDTSQVTNVNHYEVMSRDGLTSYTVTQRMSYYYAQKADKMPGVEQFALILDLDLDLNNLWDLVPYSFVVDWFFNLGDCLNAIDNYYTITSRYQSVGTIESLKATRDAFGTFSEGIAGMFKNLSLTQTGYARQCLGSVALDPVPDSILTPFKPRHIVEGGALLVQRLL